MNLNLMQKGFTLIELVVVIVILGILSAIALPKFVNLSSQAGAAAAQGVAAAVSSASSINYAARKAGNGSAVPVSDCTQGTLSGMLAGGLPTGYTITLGSACTTADGGTANCTVTNSQSSATATVICVP